jgi:hypothetical protein
MAVALKGDFFSSVLLIELFLGILVLSTAAGLPWKTHVARIAQGLGVYAMIQLITEAFHVAKSSQGYAAYAIWVHLRISTYLTAVAWWIVMMWREAQQPRELPEKIRRDLAGLNRMLEGDLLHLGGWKEQ